MISTVAIDLARQCEANISVLTVIPPNAENLVLLCLKNCPRSGKSQGSCD